MSQVLLHIILNLYLNPTRKLSLFIPSFTDKETETQRLNDLLRVTWIVWGRIKFWTLSLQLYNMYTNMYIAYIMYTNQWRYYDFTYCCALGSS